MNKIHHSIQCLTIGIVTLLFVLASCSNDIVYQDAHAIDDTGWYKNDFVSFDYNATDTTGTYNILVDIRNTPDYPFQNFWLFVHSTSPKGIEFSDTLECMLADQYGRWIGKSSGSMYSVPVLFLSNIQFPQEGTYHFDLVQGMRADTLQGIHEIGIRIQKVTNDNDGKE
ncbi:MAG: gliding motility lipoprotein GldH [Paludibacteraceae bacterium]|nr:gliding motility lipoprotein GldH [Paludibacteraceae bacterium]